MARKRHRGEGSRSSQSYDHRHFVSEAASERYHNVLATRTIIPERGFWPGSMQGQLSDMIRERNWVALVRPPEPAVENIVREFYANALAASNDMVRVRGKDVSFSVASINEYYDLNNESGVDEYSRFKFSKINLAELIQTLCSPGATWTFRGEEALHFSSSDLSRYGKAWYYFLCAKLMPTTHLSEIIKDRAILLYCLIMGQQINVGQVIHKSIRSTIEGTSLTGLPHPSLICGLCARAGVRWAENESRQQPKVLLDERIIRKLKQWDGAPAHPRGAGFILNPPAMEDPQSLNSEEPIAASSPPRAPSTSVAITENEFSIKLRRLQSHMDSRFKEISQQNATIAHRQDVMHTYNMHFNAALADQFARLNPGDAAVQFPEPPTLPVYPPQPSTSVMDDVDISDAE